MPLRLPFSPDYPIRTERLLLRPIDPVGDVDAVLAYQSRPDVCRWIPYEPRDRAQVVERLADATKARSTIDTEGQAINLALVEQSSDRMIGDVMLFAHSVEHESGEIGYVLNPDVQGRGYATEAGFALLGLAFDGLGLRRVVARTDAENAASQRVLRRLGMRQEAYLRENEWFKGRWSDEIDFAMLAAEWAAR